jgi:hypothetical protein
MTRPRWILLVLASVAAGLCSGASKALLVAGFSDPRIRARGAEMADFFGYRLNGPKGVPS